jgi:hypothetical protein
MSGTDKRKLLIIEKRGKPVRFKGISMNSLLVLYYVNKYARMTSENFKKWPINCDVELQQKSKNILLVLDNCAAHPHLDSANNNQLEFLSPTPHPWYRQRTWDHKKFEDFISRKIYKLHP